MEPLTASKYPASYGLALALASLINSILVVAKETSPWVMAWMKRMTFHHWVTHSVIVMLVFFGSGWLFARANGGRGVNVSTHRLINLIIAGIGFGGLIIVGFYAIDG